MKAIISDIQKFSLHDGPGIRTTVFFKGCNMHCPWCHNPETLSQKPELLFYSSKCIGCGYCFDECGEGALTLTGKGKRSFNKALCTGCGQCASVCAPGALKMVGKAVPTEEIMESILLDKDYYLASGGGVTLSGGEVLMQADAAAELLRLCRANAIPTAIESNLSFPYTVIEKLLPWLDRIYCDIKFIDDSESIKYTGVSNKNTLENIKKAVAAGIPVTVRTPIIPGFTDSEDNIRGIALWLKENAAVEGYELLNYNPLAEAKSDELGKEYAPGSLKRKTAAEMARLQNIAALFAE